MDLNSTQSNPEKKSYLGYGTRVCFIKNKNLFNAISDNLNLVISQNNQNSQIKVWVPGCSNGAEVYSLAITIFNAIEILNTQTEFKIIGTDINPLQINEARRGRYFEYFVQNFSPGEISLYFDKYNKHQYIIKTFIREKCLFGKHDIINQMPLDGNDIIDLSNLNIQYDVGLQIKIMETMHNFLRPKGLLILDYWKLPKSMQPFYKIINSKPCLFQKIETEKKYLNKTFSYNVNIEKNYSVTNILPRNCHYENCQNRILNEQNNSMLEEMQIMIEQLQSARVLEEKRSLHFANLKDDLFNIINTIDTAIIVLDNQFRFKHFNKSGAKLFNLLDSDIGREIFDIQPNFKVLGLKSIILTAINEQRILEKEVFDEKGTYYLLKVNPIFVKNSMLKNIIINCINIDTVKKTQQNLAFHSQILTNIKEAIVVVDNSDRIIFFNKTAENRYRIKMSDIVGQKLETIFSCIYLNQQDEKNAEQSVNQFGYWQGDLIHITRDARRFFINSIVNTIKDSNGQVIGKQAVLHDITERKRLEQELVKQNGLVEKILNNIPVMVFIYNRDLKVLSINHEIKRVLGWTEEDIQDGKFIKKIFPDSANRCLLMEYLSMFEAGWCDFSVTAKDSRVVESTWSNYKLSDNRFVSIGIDISHYKDIERDLQQVKQGLEKQVDVKTKEVLRFQNEINNNRKLVNIGTHTAVMAHELRNPLATINICLHNIKKRIDDQHISKNINRISKKIEETEKFINDILYYSGIKSPQFKRIRIYYVLYNCFQEVSEIKNCNVILDYTDLHTIKDVIIDADINQIKIVLTNILKNAYEAVDSNSGIIKVRAQTMNNLLKIDFEDNGTGIDGKHMGKIYDLFFTTKKNGTGLGLSVCYQILALHKGSISISSQKNKGTNVTVSLPYSPK